MSNIALILMLLVFASVIAWNVYPPFRKRLRGWSTIIEGTLGTVLTYFGVFADALQEAKNLGYLPENIETYLPTIILVWVILKRLQTNTPVGGK